MLQRLLWSRWSAGMFSSAGAWLWCGLIAWGAENKPAPDRPASDAARDYLGIVQTYADTMIAHGRDEYGAVRTPLFAAVLDRKTLRLPEKLPPEIPGIRVQDRTLTGANPMHDENLYQVLFALTEITGDRKYAAEADKALKWFFENTQSPATGFFAWGEHLGWDFTREGPEPGRTIHEFYRPWVLWERSSKLAPQAVRTFALGVWQHQISDQKTGAFSRHASYHRHGPGKGNEFPRQGGFYIATWAAAYQRFGDAEMLQAIEVLLNSFQNRRNPKSGAIPSQENILELFWPPSTVSLAIDLWDASHCVPAPLGQAMRAAAAQIDTVFLGMKHDLGPGGKGFIKNASSSTLEPGDIREQLRPKALPAWYPFTHTWLSAYGMPTDAKVAMHCLLRHQQTQDEGYRRLFLDAARRYLSSEPDTNLALFPTAVAEAIANLLGAYRLTGDKVYLDRADRFGRKGVHIFFDGSPLPRASSRHEHYEAITGGDTLVMTLLDLWAARTRPQLKLSLIWTDR